MSIFTVKKKLTLKAVLQENLRDKEVLVEERSPPVVACTTPVRSFLTQIHSLIKLIFPMVLKAKRLSFKVLVMLVSISPKRCIKKEQRLSALSKEMLPFMIQQVLTHKKLSNIC